MKISSAFLLKVGCVVEGATAGSKTIDADAERFAAAFLRANGIKEGAVLTGFRGLVELVLPGRYHNCRQRTRSAR